MIIPIFGPRDLAPVLAHALLHSVIGLTLPPIDANSFSSTVRLVRALGEDSVQNLPIEPRYRVIFNELLTPLFSSLCVYLHYGQFPRQPEPGDQPQAPTTPTAQPSSLTRWLLLGNPPFEMNM